MQAEKPHKGNITNWCKLGFIGNGGLGYVIRGYVEGHPEFGSAPIRTSFVVSHDEATGEIETNNSRYTLVGPELAD